MSTTVDDSAVTTTEAKAALPPSNATASPTQTGSAAERPKASYMAKPTETGRYANGAEKATEAGSKNLTNACSAAAG